VIILWLELELENKEEDNEWTMRKNLLFVSRKHKSSKHLCNKLRAKLYKNKWNEIKLKKKDLKNSNFF
jgi:hypothetical protein